MGPMSMSSSSMEPPAAAANEALPDKDELVQVRAILKSLAQTITVIKLYPAGHDHVRRYRDDLYDRLNGFLGQDRPLDLGIGENAFTYLGQVVYQDDNLQKSLPYFFFKDGMLRLSFLPGLTPADLQDFLALIRDAFLQVSGSADVVDLMWQKEIEHIRFFAPNEFLTSKVAVGTTMPLDFSIDPRVLTEGTIGLAPEDRPGLLNAAVEPAVRESGAAYGERTAAPPGRVIPPEEEAEDAAALETLLESERRVPVEQDFFETMSELLRVEDRAGSFGETLDYLAQYENRLIQAAHFSGALQLWDEIAELARDLKSSQPAKSSALGELEERFKGQASPEALRAVVRQGVLWDFPPFFKFLDRIGPATLALVGDLYESSEDRSFRAQAEAFFARTGRNDPALLAALADPDKPVLARAVLSALASQKDRRVLPYLTAFSGHPDASVRHAAAQIARAFPGREARQILAGFLEDRDGTLRLQAALALRTDAASDAAPALLRLVDSPEFRDRDAEEITAVLEALGATRTPEALAFLGGWVAKRRWRLNEKTLVLALASVRGLERMGTPEAKAELGAGARRRNRRLRAACRAALARWAAGAEPGRGAR